MIVITCLLFLLRWVALLGSAALSFVCLNALIQGNYYTEQKPLVVIGAVVNLVTVIVLGVSTITTGF